MGAWIETVATISISSITGAATILLFRAGYERRRRYSALHAELDDILTDLKYMRESLEENPDKRLQTVVPSDGFPSSALESLRVVDPLLYTHIDSEVDNLRIIYDILGVYGSISSFDVESIEVSVNSQGSDNENGSKSADEEGEKNTSETVEQLKRQENRVLSAIKSLEDYKEKTIGRRLFYFGTIDQSHHLTEEASQEGDQN